MRIVLSFILMTLCFACFAFAYEGEAYTTPDSWSKTVTANGVKASTKGINLSNGVLKLGLTTRVDLTAYDDVDVNVYQYFRARLSDVKLGAGTFSLNLNLRGAYDGSSRSSNLREYYAYYDSLDYERDKSGDWSLRIYQANVQFDNVLKYTNLTLGRLYLSSFDGMKIDGGSLTVTPCEYFALNVFYGLPVSYYSNLRTQVVGANIEIPIEKSGTRIKAEYAYFMFDGTYDKSKQYSVNSSNVLAELYGMNYDTQVIKGRVDQAVNTKYVNATIYGDVESVASVLTYEVGFDANVTPSRTGVSAYVMGQAGKNDDQINPYIASFDQIMGEQEEYIMYGARVSQGITDYVLVAVGFEGKTYNTVSYANRDYMRVFGEVDLVGLIHRNNYLAVIGDYYTAASTKTLDDESKFLVGARITQRFLDNIDVWIGANVMNYQYRNTPIKLSSTAQFASYKYKDQNTTLAYIGGMWQITDWCVVQLDYTFEYSDLFTNNENTQTVQAWVNFLW